MGIEILAAGSCVPSRVVTNDEMSRMVDTSDEWIVTRTGIRERRFCAPGETHLGLARTAAERALERAGIDRSRVAVCIAATVCADFLTPSCACLLQRELGLPEETACFDLNAACAGSLYAMRTARGFLTPEKPYALVIGCETLSRLSDFTDRSTCVLFGDGAGALVLALNGEAPEMTDVLGSRGNSEALFIPGAAGAEKSFVRMNGQAVFRFAVDIIPRCIGGLLQKSGARLEEVDWFVLHQANERIIDNVAKRLGLPPEKVFKNLARYGNTSAASIPIALDELLASGRARSGQRVILVGFGGGLTWAGIMVTIGGSI